ncbi:MAG: gliding motility-associated C-terminal domain-containing protein, partial [Chitinophagales bacterium]
CSATDTIHLSDSTVSDLDLPNAFSPEGANKLFKVIVTGNVTLHYFRIYNRWGAMVYETNDITAGWNGKYNEAPQPFDVYVYQVEAVRDDGNVIRKDGNVTLIR